MRALGIAAAAAVAFAPLTVLAPAPGVALAAPCVGDGSSPTACEHCRFYVNAYHTANVCDVNQPPRPAVPPPTRVPVATPEMPPEPPIVPVPAPIVLPPIPRPPTTTPAQAQTPKINPQAGGPSNAALISPPKGLDAPPQAVAAAKAAPPTRVNPASPPEPPMQVYDFDHQVQNAVNVNNGNVDLIKADNQILVRPRHWDYIDYDDYRRPVLYNPLDEAMTFRYLYSGAYREAFVQAGGRIVLDAAIVGIYPFTAVGYSHVVSGSFYGGASVPANAGNGPPPPDYLPPVPPDVYHNVTASVRSANQIVEVGEVQVVGHDAGQPMGSQDTFMLNDTTFAWGQINDANSNSQITVTKTQSLPGIGPTDNGSYLLALAALKEPAPPSAPRWPFALSYGALALVVCLAAWMLNRRNRRAEDLTGTD